MHRKMRSLLPARRRSGFAAIFLVLAQLACAAPSVGAQPERGLIQHLQKELGLNEVQARDAVGALLVFARERLPQPEFNDLADGIGAADQLMQDATLHGVVTRPLDTVEEYEQALASLGIAQSRASRIPAAVLQHLGTAGMVEERDILASVLD
jgi:hypothetical protein